MTELVRIGLDFDQVMVSTQDGSEIILVHSSQGLRAWRNSCPHVGIGLDYGDGRCLIAPDVLVCSMHGARFDAASGLCTDGPCAGDCLQSVPIHITKNKVYLDDVSAE